MPEPEDSLICVACGESVIIEYRELAPGDGEDSEVMPYPVCTSGTCPSNDPVQRAAGVSPL